MGVSFLINGPSGGAVDIRVRHLVSGWPERVFIHHRSSRKVAGIGGFVSALFRDRPDVVCVVDTSYTGVLAAAVFRASGGRARLVLDTGDAVSELGRSLGRSHAGVAATHALERLAHIGADRIVVRGTFHRELLRSRGLPKVFVVRDGVDTRGVGPADGTALRARLGLGDAMVVAVLGSLSWNAKHQLVYGWDLVHALTRLRDLNVVGLVVGDGDGEPALRALAARLGLTDRVVFAGRAPMSDMSQWLAAADVWLSTQTNDVPGRVRTTGKLPLYMAAGRFVLATDVGEAKLLLPPSMRLPYDGVRDDAWPIRLAERIRRLESDRAELTEGARLREVAIRELDYEVLSPLYRRALGLDEAAA